MWIDIKLIFNLFFNNFIHVYTLIHPQLPFPLHPPTHTDNTLPSHLWGLSILGAGGGEAHWVQLMLPVGIVRDNTGLTVGRTYTGNHSYSELVSTIVMSCPDNSISKHYSHPLVLIWKNIMRECSLFFFFFECFLSHGDSDINVPFTDDHSIVSYFRHFDEFLSSAEEISLVRGGSINNV